MPAKTISPKELQQRIRAGEAVELIDVRTAVEFREVHAKVARNVPLDSIDPHDILASRSGNSDDPLYLICRGGSRGSQACQKFTDAGFTNVINVEGGTLAWDEANLEVERGKKAVSLERQVRIAAGSIVLIGSVLGYFINPYFIGIPAFVGAGLLFAGITDSCAMGMMLARMPWNQVANDDNTSCCVR